MGQNGRVPPGRSPEGTPSLRHVSTWRERYDPFKAVMEANPGLRVTIEMLTIHAAYALGTDEAVGSLLEGKLADLIVLSANPLETPPDALRHIEVLMTMVGGEVEHSSEGWEALCPSAPEIAG